MNQLSFNEMDAGTAGLQQAEDPFTALPSEVFASIDCLLYTSDAADE